MSQALLAGPASSGVGTARAWDISFAGAIDVLAGRQGPWGDFEPSDEDFERLQRLTDEAVSRLEAAEQPFREEGRWIELAPCAPEDGAVHIASRIGMCGVRGT